MSLVFVTGASTAGKSTIARELLLRGYRAYDTEQNDMSAWFDKETGERVAGFGEIPERTKAWFDRHEWKISIEKIKKLATLATHEYIFICGTGSNADKVRDLCDKVIWLRMGERTIRERVTIPREHDWGTNPYELAGAIEGNAKSENEYRSYGATMIDATQPLKKVVTDILAVIEV